MVADAMRCDAMRFIPSIPRGTGVYYFGIGTNPSFSLRQISQGYDAGNLYFVKGGESAFSELEAPGRNTIR